jgi:moderate conductance mechanosensitive channel
MIMSRALFVLLLLVTVALPAPAQESGVPPILPADRTPQQITPPQPPTPVPAPIPAPPPARPEAEQRAPEPAPHAASGQSVDELERLLRTLENDAERQRLIETIRALVQTHRGTAAPESPMPDRVAGRFIESLSSEIGGVGAAILRAAAFIADAPKLGHWITSTLSDPLTRSRVWETLQTLFLILLGSVPALLLSRHTLKPARLRLEQRAAGVTGWHRWPYGLYHLLLALVPSVMFGIAAFAILAVLEPTFVVALIASAMINYAVVAQAVGLFSWMVLAPKVASLRLIPIDGESAVYVHIWVKRITNLSVYGTFLASASYIVGLPYSGYVFLIKLLGVFVALMLAMLIMQNRQSVAAYLAGRAANGATPAPRSLRQRLCEMWHVFALGYVGIAMAIWLLQPEEALAVVFRATVLTIVMTALAWSATRIVRRLIRRAFRPPAELRGQFPNVEARVNRYSQIFDTLAGVLIWLFAALVALSGWGLDSFAWFFSPTGRRATSSVISIALTILVAVLLWEGIRVGLERYLGVAAAGRSADEQRRVARMRTLIPLIYRLLFSVLAVLVVLVVLSELGINIAPLLAVSGVVGIAIGLGAQQLIRDLIAGVAIVIEDSLAVGDVVQLGTFGGVVESMSLRVLRLRSVDGTVHTIPYGEFHTISNQTKDFSFAVLETQAGVGNDIDRVIEVIQATADELRDDPDFKALIRDAFEFFGVERVTDIAVVYRGRFKVLPGRQWRVVRAFNRRIKMAFDRDGITLPTAPVALVQSPAMAPARA